MKVRTALFKKLNNEVAVQYTNTSWPSARRWLTRVGQPRLSAESASAEASGLLESVNLSIHRNEPELYDLLVAAREATAAYSLELTRDDWRRFEGRPKQ